VVATASEAGDGLWRARSGVVGYALGGAGQGVCRQVAGWCGDALIQHARYFWLCVGVLAPGAIFLMACPETASGSVLPVFRLDGGLFERRDTYGELMAGKFFNSHDMTHPV